MDSSRREDQLMSKELYEAAMCDNGEVIIDRLSDEELLKKTLVLNNILHVAVRYKNMTFVWKALSRFPHLMWEVNLERDTPFHIAAETKNSELVGIVCNAQEDPTPLRMQNSVGNTPLHVAIIHQAHKVAYILASKDPYLAVMVNASMEAPLHLAILHFPDTIFFLEDYDDMLEVDVLNENLLKVIEEKQIDSLGDPFVKKQEKMVWLIRALLEIASYVAGWRDADGLTPLHRAAQLDKSYNLAVLKFIIEHCPHSMEVRDSCGKTILHHLIHRIFYRPRGLDFLRTTHMSGLINHQDLDGNTPLHLALINSDLVMLQLLQDDLGANEYIKNKKGMSPLILKKQSDFVAKMLAEGPKMTDTTSHLAEWKDVFKLREYGEKVGFSALDLKDSDGRKVIHKLVDIQSGNLIIPTVFLEFIEYLSDYRLYFERDNNGDTPVHILAQLNTNNIMIHLATGPRDDPTYTQNLNPDPLPDGHHRLHSSFSKYTYTRVNLGKTTFLIDLLNLCLKRFDKDKVTQNKKGNTVLHEAAKAKNYPVLIKLAECFRGAPSSVNDRNETVLHLLAPLNPFPEVAKDVMDDIIKNNTQNERHDLDEDGLSPLMIAIQAGNIEFAERLVSICPRLAGFRDPQGSTFWHHFVKAPPISSCNFANNSFTTKDVLSLLETKDNQQNTALHLAIDQRRFDFARLFLSLHRTHKTHSLKTDLLRIPNKAGDTPGHMIGSLSYLPDEFERFIWEDYTMIGTRSIWGIPTTQIKEYVNTMGVIAALLTTITFTATFTVPGGLDQEKGIPLLIKDPAFHVFIISDILAMCLSMMVLFCLLWIMATGNKTKSVVLLDFSIILLLASFYTTLLTFMTGLYATLHLVKLWIAIFALVPCSLLLLLMHKCLVNKWIIPSGKRILLFFAKASYSTKKAYYFQYFVKHALCSRSNSRSRIPV